MLLGEWHDGETQLSIAIISCHYVQIDVTSQCQVAYSLDIEILLFPSTKRLI
jgi:hypothetical protein